MSKYTPKVGDLVRTKGGALAIIDCVSDPPWSAYKPDTIWDPPGYDRSKWSPTFSIAPLDESSFNEHYAWYHMSEHDAPAILGNAKDLLKHAPPKA